MNISQYKPSNTMREDAVESLSQLPLIGEAVEPAGRRRLRPGESSKSNEAVSLEPNVVLEVDGARYECSCGDGRVVVVKCDSTASALEVPSEIAGLPVMEIGPHAFCTCYLLKQVALPGAVSAIGSYAFMNTALASFDSPENLRSIGDNAFYKCNRLRRVSLNDRLERIGANAFRETALEEIDVPLSVELIGLDAFKDTKLVYTDQPSLRIADGHPYYRLELGGLYRLTPEGLELVQVLDENTVDFEGPNGLAAIGTRAFAGLTLLKHAHVPEGVTHIGDAAFKGCSRLTDVSLPDSVHSIGKQAFCDTALRSLRIPASLESVGAAAFYTGGSIAERFNRTIQQVSVPEENAHFYLDHDILCWKRSSKGSIALLYVGDAERVVIPPNITAIGAYAFLKASCVRHLVIHDAIDFIDVGGLDFGRGLADVEYLVYDGNEQPVKRYRLVFPPGKAGWQAARQVFSRGSFNLAYAFAAVDNAILITQDVHYRSKAMLERLKDPVMLDDHMREAFEKKLARSLASTVVAFGQNGYHQGIDLLFEAGTLTADNIDGAIEAAAASGEVAVVSRLIEIKRTSFQAPLFDFEL
ncbi:MAG TPA: hypothetical protein DCP91_13240 [Eggerthellaceae bacterium]|nr:hypothetical protein [Eggerthellaceae bacterium]